MVPDPPVVRMTLKPVVALVVVFCAQPIFGTLGSVTVQFWVRRPV